jgi:hypothetical protein
MAFGRCFPAAVFCPVHTVGEKLYGGRINNINYPLNTTTTLM